MKLLKRCYSCNKFIWPWSKTINTEKVGIVHKVCVVTAFENHVMNEVSSDLAKKYRKQRLACAIEYLNIKEWKE